MPKSTNLRSLLLDLMRSLYFSEKKLVKAIPKLARASQDLRLKAALNSHLAETRGHVRRLDEAFQILDTAARPTTSSAFVSLINRGGKAAHLVCPAAVRDADIIGAAQGVEHFEMGAYEHACALAEALDEFEVVKLLQENFEEEDAANRLLSKIAADVHRAALSGVPTVVSRVAAR